MMQRDECLKVFKRHRKDEIVVAVYMAAQEMTHIMPSDLNYTFTGAMGQGSSHSLGLALGRPDKRVFTIPSFQEATFNKSTFDLRDKTAIKFDREKVDRHLSFCRRCWNVAEGELCDICGFPMLDVHCKLICRNCGFMRDCSDP